MSITRRFSKSAAILILVLASRITVSAGEVYFPKTLNPKTARVVVVIHGCLQDAQTMSQNSGWNAVADANNLAIFYPQVPSNSHLLNCWGWFKPENQVRGSGQLEAIVTELNSIKSAHGLSANPTYVTGISSGGATVAGLLACYPDVFAAGAIHSGPPYGIVSDEFNGVQLLQGSLGNKSPRTGPCDPAQYNGGVMVVHGSFDPVVPSILVDQIVDQFDPGAQISGTAKSFAATSNQASYSITNYSDSSSGDSRIRVVRIEGLGHAWAGWTSLTPRPTSLARFFDPRGPSSTDLIWDFFKTFTK